MAQSESTPRRRRQAVGWPRYANPRDPEFKHPEVSYGVLWEQEAAGSNPAIPTENAGQPFVTKPLECLQDHLTVV